MSRSSQQRHGVRAVPVSAIAALLLAAYVVAFAQRQLPATLAEPMTRRFDLADAEMGALIGYGFGFFYALFAIPAGWLVDSTHRMRLLAIGLALASIATAMSAFASSLYLVAALRLLVGVGQSVLVPAAYSLLGDIVPRDRIGRAVAGFAIGPFLGAGLMLVLGGRVANVTDWRIAFVITGGVGLAISAVVLSLGEPQRKCARRADAERLDARRYLARHWASVLAIDGALTFAAMAGHIILAWGTMWLVRGHDLSTGEATLGLGLAVIFGGIAGTVAAGAGGDALLRRWAGLPRLALFSVAMIAATLLAGPIFATSSLPVALVGLPLLVALVAAALVLGPASLQEITPPGLRGRQHGLAILLVNWLGLGFGPLLVGIVSDIAGDPEALGRVMAIAIPIMLALSAGIAAAGARAQARSATLILQETMPGRPSSTT